MNNKTLVYTALAPIMGKFYPNREELDDAVHEHYGPIQALFNQQSHREFVDMLIRVGWVAKKLDGFLVTLGEQTKPTPEPVAPTPPQAPTQELTLTYAEMQTINEIGSAPEGMVSQEQYGLNHPLIEGLIEKKLVFLTGNFPTAERQFNTQAIETAVNRALQEIKETDYQAAANSLSVAEMYKQKNAKFETMYALTEHGRAVRERLGSATIKI